MIRAKGKIKRERQLAQKELEETTTIPVVKKRKVERVSNISSKELTNVISETLIRVYRDFGVDFSQLTADEKALMMVRYLKYGVGWDRDHEAPFKLTDHEYRRIPLCRKHK